MNTRQLTLVVTVAAIALVFVGIGYAYTAYTVNNGNQTEVAYVTVTQNDIDQSAAYKFANGTTIQFDTYNEKDTNTVYYKVRGGVEIANGAHPFICAKLGSIQLHAAMSSATAVPPAKMAIGINDTTGFNAVGKWVYVITDSANNLVAYKNTSATEQDHGAWNIVKNLEFVYNNTNNAYTDVTLNVYYGYSESETKDIGTEKFLDNMGEAQANRAPQKLSGASIVFVASDDYTITYNANNGTSNTYTQVAFKGVNGLITFATSGFTAPDTKAFKGWALASDATEVITSLNVTENKTLYAIYE